MRSAAGKASSAPPVAAPWTQALIALLLAALPMAAYWPAYDGQFIWDDDAHVADNKTIQQPGALRKIWFEPLSVPQYYPLTHTGFWLAYQAFGLNPVGYHVVNVLLHALGAVLLWRVLIQLQLPPPAAVLAAAIFAVHPVHVESVAWISELKNTLSGVFYFAALLVYLHYLRLTSQARSSQSEIPNRPVAGLGTYFGFRMSDLAFRRLVYATALVLFTAALLSKTVTATLPAVVLVLIWWRHGRIALDDVRPLLPFFLVGIAMGLVTVWYEKEVVGAHGSDFALSAVDRVLVAGRALWFYAGKLLWPTKLAFIYDRWEIDSRAAWQYLFPAAALALPATLAMLHRRIGRGPLAAVLIFAGTLVPALGFFDVYPFTFSFVADHFQYLASVAIIVLFAALLAGIVHHPRALAAAGAMIVAVLFVLTWRQCAIYQNLEVLWRDTIAKSPRCWMAYNNLSSVLNREGRHEEALASVLESLRINPDNDRAHNNAGIAYENLGRPDKAAEHFVTSIKLFPGNPGPYRNMGRLFAVQNHVDDAIGWYRQALKVDPLHVVSLVDLGASLLEKGELDEARTHFDAALRIEPGLSRAHYGLGMLAMRAGDHAAAATHFESALACDPRVAETHHGLGAVRLHQGDLSRAMRHFDDALALNPDLEQARYHKAVALAYLGRSDEAVLALRGLLERNPRHGDGQRELANLLAAMGRPEQAIAHYLAAIELMPQNAELHNNIAASYSAMNQIPQAVTHLVEALRLKPDYPDAHNNLGVALESQQRFEEAIEQYRRAIALRDDYIDARFNLALTLAKQGRTGEARRQFQQLVEKTPDHLAARFHLGLALEAEGDLSGAIGQYRQMLKMNPDQMEALVRLAWVLASRDSTPDEAAQAVELAQRAVRLTRSAEPVALDALAAAYAAAGRFDDAVRMAVAAADLAKDVEPELARRIQTRIGLYRSGKPYRSLTNEH